MGWRKPRGGVGSHRPRQAACLSLLRELGAAESSADDDMIRFAPGRTSPALERAGVEISMEAETTQGIRVFLGPRAVAMEAERWVDRGHLGCKPNTAP